MPAGKKGRQSPGSRTVVAASSTKRGGVLAPLPAKSAAPLPSSPAIAKSASAANNQTRVGRSAHRSRKGLVESHEHPSSSLASPLSSSRGGGEKDVAPLSRPASPPAAGNASAAEATAHDTAEATFALVVAAAAAAAAAANDVLADDLALRVNNVSLAAMGAFAPPARDDDDNGGGRSSSSLHDSGERCPICLQALGASDETGSVAALEPCSHSFCTPCITTWTLSRSTCPLCVQACVLLVVRASAEPGAPTLRSDVVHPARESFVTEADQLMCLDSNFFEEEIFRLKRAASARLVALRRQPTRTLDVWEREVIGHLSQALSSLEFMISAPGRFRQHSQPGDVMRDLYGLSFHLSCLQSSRSRAEYDLRMFAHIADDESSGEGVLSSSNAATASASSTAASSLHSAAGVLSSSSSSAAAGSAGTQVRWSADDDYDDQYDEVDNYDDDDDDYDQEFYH